MAEAQFAAIFKELTRHPVPRDWQATLTTSAVCRDRIVRIPTGLGKTEGVLGAWLFHRAYRGAEQWPRRLVWCLPMRVLVEQTACAAEVLASRIPESKRPKVYVAMGGEDAGEWFLQPEDTAIIVGTQDMLLSRALSRGYASPRGRWPSEFGLLNHDTLWVMDEVQLMDVGLATSAQLQAYQDQDRAKGLKPRFTWWMSATLQPDWLSTVDTAPHHPEWIADPVSVPPEERVGGPWDIPKSLALDAIPAQDTGIFAKRILKEHAALPDGEYGRITLVVCNTVDRACKTYRALKSDAEQQSVDVRLVHSRFRPKERERWRSEFLDKSHCVAGVNRIIVATQVIEAGVDISAGLLITDRAPWPSLVQRFGRCARYGGSGNVLVVNRGDQGDGVVPYSLPELQSAWASLEQLRSDGVGIASLEQYEASLTAEARSKLYPYDPQHLLLRREFEELFDTTPDLTGADIDISRFIRTGEERDLQVFWLEIPQPPKRGPVPQPSDRYVAHRRELCAVPFLKAREWLFEKGTTRLRKGKRAWVWDWIDGKWVVATPELLVPGRIICVAADSGGYVPELGFDPASPLAVAPVPVPASASDNSENQQNGEEHGGCWKTIADHTREVVSTLDSITGPLSIPEALRNLMRDAALWHDWGKSHPAFQGCMRDERRPDRVDLAKAPDKAWQKRYRYLFLDGSDRRAAFRHELASALGLFTLLQMYKPDHAALLGPWAAALEQLGRTPVHKHADPPPVPLISRLLNYTAEEFDLLVYLVAAHHGKVRVALHAAPADQDYRDTDGRGLPIRGVREGDVLPSVALVPGEPPLPEVTLTLAPAAMGLSDRTGMSWRERVIRLLKDHGPAKLAYLEAIMVAADRRASRLTTPDPLLTPEAIR